jgi:hypothetical protein
MDNDLINYLVHKASKLGAQGIEVTGWIPPQSASADPIGTLILLSPAPTTGAMKPWYQD